MLTKRQWLMLQWGLLAYQKLPSWDEEDGQPPTQAEIDELSSVIGDMDYEEGEEDINP